LRSSFSGPRSCLPEIGKAIGQTIREFRSSTAAKDEESEQEKQAEAAKLSETGGEKAPEGMIESRDPQNQTAEAERPGNRAGTKSDE